MGMNSCYRHIINVTAGLTAVGSIVFMVFGILALRSGYVEAISMVWDAQATQNVDLNVLFISGTVQAAAAFVGACVALYAANNKKARCIILIWAGIAIECAVGAFWLMQLVGTREGDMKPIIVREANRICHNVDQIKTELKCATTAAVKTTADGTPATGRRLAAGKTELNLVNKIGGCKVLDNFCAAPAGFDEKTACVCSGDGNGNGRFCNENGKCTVQQGTVCGGKLEVGVGATFETSYPCANEPDSRSKFVADGFTHLDKVWWSLLVIGVLVSISALASLAYGLTHEKHELDFSD